MAIITRFQDKFDQSVNEVDSQPRPLLAEFEREINAHDDNIKQSPTTADQVAGGLEAHLCLQPQSPPSSIVLHTSISNRAAMANRGVTVDIFVDQYFDSLRYIFPDAHGLGRSQLGPRSPAVHSLGQVP